MAIGDQARYADTLARINQLSSLQPRAIFDLAYSLQSAWEARHLFEYFQKSTQSRGRAEVPAEFALGLGSVFLAGDAIARPWGKASFLISFEKLSQSFSLGYAAGSLSQRPMDVPPPPALFLRLGIESQRNALLDAEKRHFADRSVAEAAGAASMNLVFQAAALKIAASVPSRPGKALAWGAALGAGYLAHAATGKAVRLLVDRTRLAQSQAELSNALASLELAVRGASGDPKPRQLRILSQASRAASAAFRYLATRDFDLLEAEALHEIDRSATPQDPGQAEAAFNRRVNSWLERNHLKPSPAASRAIARDMLGRMDVDPDDEQGAASIERAIAAWDEDIAASARAEADSYRRLRNARNDGVGAFKAFLASRSQSEDRALAKRARAGSWHSTPDGFFLQIAAYFRSFDDPFLAIYADQVFKPHGVRSALSLRHAVTQGD